MKRSRTNDENIEESRKKARHLLTIPGQNVANDDDFGQITAFGETVANVDLGQYMLFSETVANDDFGQNTTSSETISH